MGVSGPSVLKVRWLFIPHVNLYLTDDGGVAAAALLGE